MSSLHATIFPHASLLAVKGFKLVYKTVVKVRVIGLRVPTLKVQLHLVNSYGG
jgi:hypothetical protein